MQPEDPRPIVLKQRAGNYFPHRKHKAEMTWLQVFVICTLLLNVVIWTAVLNHPAAKLQHLLDLTLKLFNHHFNKL